MMLSYFIFHTMLKNDCHFILMLKKVEIMHPKKKPTVTRISSLMPFPFNPKLYVLGCPLTLGTDL